jgi:L-ribulokinase
VAGESSSRENVYLTAGAWLPDAVSHVVFFERQHKSGLNSGGSVAIVAGVDFGTLSVRVTLLDSDKGRLGTASAEYALKRKREDPDFATQSHTEQMDALVKATREVLEKTGVPGASVEAIAIDTTGSSVIPVGANLEPLDDYYLWCDHRALEEAQQITALAHQEKLEAIEWCGGVYSHEWGFAKLLHWLRHNPDKRGKLVTALENCDMVAATLCGITEAKDVKRSACAMGHKWMWNPRWGGLPPQEFLSKLDPLFDGIRAKLDGEYLTSDKLAGVLALSWAEAMGLRAGIPVPVSALDAHWDALGAGCREGDVVNVVGTSTCIIAMSHESTLVPGVCGVVPGSVHPGFTGIEAGLSATGDIFEAIAKRAGTDVRSLSKGLEKYHGGQTGLLRLSWDNGDRTVLVNSELGGVTLGWNLIHTAQDELFAAIEGTAFHTRIILERMAEKGVPVERVINAGGIPQNNQVLNQVYANVLNKPILVPDGTPTSLGSGIFGLLAAGTFNTVEEAQAKMCLKHRTYLPQPEAVEVYKKLYRHYRNVYFALGTRNAEVVRLGDVLPDLRKIAAAVTAAQGFHASQPLELSA